ncbi:MAG: phosphate signaling complex protein PhoU [Pseudomonadota bacterium]
MAVAQAHPSYQNRQSLEAELSRMAGLVESQLQAAIAAFERRDPAAAQRVIDMDRRVDAYDADIESKVIELLAEEVLPQDALREVITIMKLTGELERVGDLAKNVAKRTLVLSQEAPATPATGVMRMGRVSLRQFSDVLTAFASRNLEAAEAVWRGDDEVDELYNSVFQELLLAMMADSGKVNACTHLVFVAKNFERVGDHATNIAEALHFLLTGEPLADPRPKVDETSTTLVAPPNQSGAR